MELNTQLQHRTAFQPTGLLMREDGESNNLEGVAIVTNAETILWEGSDWREVEIIDPSCLNADFMKEQDIKLNLLHERSLSFARSNKGAGSLSLEVKEDGLHFACAVPDCDLGQRAKALIENGTYTGCSFEFWAKDYEVSERVGKDGKTEYVIRHKSFARIGAITIGMDPAYEQTSVGLRELVKPAEPTEEELKAKREAEAKAETEKKTRERDLLVLQMAQLAEDAIDARD